MHKYPFAVDKATRIWIMTVMDIYQSVVQKLRADRARWPEIAERSGVPLSTVIKVGQGHTRNPRVQTLLKLDAALRDEQEHRA